MKLGDFLKDGKIPQIGFGPGGVGYSPKMKKKKEGFLLFLDKVLNKLYRRPLAQNKYVDSVSNALRQGFRLIDYSSAYGDGSLIGKAIKRSGIARSELLLTTRVSNVAQRKHCVREEFFKCLEGFGTDYVDILQFHWPVTDLYLDTWREMEKLYEEGYVKHLGVANCHKHHLESIFSICKHRPEIGQFEIHPLFTQKPLIEYYKSQDILVEAYTPLARYDDRLVRLPLLKRLEQKYHKNFVQIILRWHVQNEIVPLVRCLSKSHQKNNIDIFDFELDAEDMALIDGININSRLRYDPDNCDFSIL
jgi:diketogulonate reductase-like aldo/keto reductase